MIFHWLQQNEVVLGWLLLCSGVTFILTLILVPALMIYLPVDYFSHEKQQRLLWSKTHPVIRLPMLLLKNVAGLLLIAAGIIMLVLPGQGLLTIVAGVLLIDFPGKFQAERWVIEKKPVLKAINWVRVKAGRDELVL